ncbi:MAG: DUF1648 domain-containing protein [Deltaproteobacteria bacterium]|nr:DUF1648 domain-containing protein [Deltaproteobacteria bacterium]
MTTSNRVATPLVVLIALYVAALLQLVCYGSRLPERVAVHFGGDGSPNGWSTRSCFWLVYGALLVGSALLWIAIPFALRATPARSLNLPHREYWLAPERRERTLRFLRDWTWWFGAVLTGALVGSFQAVILGNLRPVVHVDNRVFHLLFVPFLIFTAVWTAGGYLRFRLPRGAGDR